MQLSGGVMMETNTIEIEMTAGTTEPVKWADCGCCIEGRPRPAEAR